MRKILIFSAIGAAIFMAPFVAKKYIEHKYNAFVEKISYGCEDSLFCISIDNLNISHNNIDVYAKHVLINSVIGPIKITDGTINIKKPKETNIVAATNLSSTPSESILDKLAIYNFEVTAINGDDKAVIHNVSYKEGIAIFDNADIIYNNKKINALNGKVFKNDNFIEIEKIETNIIIPFDIPKINAEQKLIIKNFGAHIDKKLAKAGSVEIGPAEFKNVYLIRNGDDISFDSEFLTINHPWLSTEPATFANVVTIFNKPLNKVDVILGNINFDIDLNNYHVSGKQSCNDWVSILPSPLPVALEQTIGNYSGELSFEIQIKPKPLFILKNKCDYACSKPPITLPSRYKCAWDTCYQGLYLQDNIVGYYVYDSKNKRNERMIIKGNDAGPGGAGWMPLKYIPLHVANAFVSLEDRGFYKHNGVLDSAIQNSLIANLELGRFTRGGSTITMQLAKNLWLTREKTLLRKIHEIFLTIPLEKCLTKEQILELYVNIIEFGSDVYGIERAANHYFNCKVSELTEEQAFYLATILPNPKKALSPDNGGMIKAEKILKERDEYHDALASFEHEIN